MPEDDLRPPRHRQRRTAVAQRIGFRRGYYRELSAGKFEAAKNSL